VIAHIGFLPVEELLPLAIASASGLSVIAWVRLRRLAGRIRARRRASGCERTRIRS
jgi:hypothetical protein